jgi:sirohydrochlorin ferrochelatase
VTPLVAVAHGSRDPRSAATMSRLVEVVRSMRPDLDVRLAFLDLSAPRLSDVLESVFADGHRNAVLTPLLLGSAFHHRVDIPALVDSASRPGREVLVADVLGPDERLITVALQRLSEAGVDTRDDDLGVALTAVGSSHARANAELRRTAAGLPVARSNAAFATATTPDVGTALTELTRQGARRLAVGSWFLAPGLLPDKVLDAAGDVPVAAPLGAHPLVAEVVLDRYRDALAEREDQARSA